MAGADATTAAPASAAPAPSETKPVRAAIKATPRPAKKPIAAKPYWLGMLPGAPVHYQTVPGATFHAHTEQLAPTGDPEHPYHPNRSPGGMVPLTDEQVATIQAYVGARVWRWRSTTHDGGALLLNMDDTSEYAGSMPNDEPMGRYLFMVRADRPGILGQPLPDPMA